MPCYAALPSGGQLGVIHDKRQRFHPQHPLATSTVDTNGQQKWQISTLLKKKDEQSLTWLRKDCKRRGCGVCRAAMLGPSTRPTNGHKQWGGKVNYSCRMHANLRLRAMSFTDVIAKTLRH